MRIAVASGKGGTGKTTIAVALSRLLSHDRNTVLVDCDVEEPNVLNFVDPGPLETRLVKVPLPTIDEEICSLCGNCSKTCRYNALAVLKDNVMVFPELCNGCGACSLVCPESSITYIERRMGTISEGGQGKLKVIEGRLDLGQAKAVPVIDAVKSGIGEGFAILDCPPGSSCPVIETVRDTDLVLLVTEPTRFGLQDLRTVLDAIEGLNIPMAIILNKVGSGNEDIHSFADGKGIPVLVEFPLDRKVASVYSRGGDLMKEVPWFLESMMLLKEKVIELTRSGSR